MTLSLDLPEEVHRWAVERAAREGVPVSTVVAQALEEQRQRKHEQDQAWIAVRDGLLERPLTQDELDAADAELDAACAD